MVTFERTKQHIDTRAISGAVHSPGLVALIVTQADTTERRWPDAPDAATLMRRARARVDYYTADGFPRQGSLAPLWTRALRSRGRGRSVARGRSRKHAAGATRSGGSGPSSQGPLWLRPHVPLCLATICGPRWGRFCCWGGSSSLSSAAVAA